MLEVGHASPNDSDSSKTFLGVRFVLLGFDPLTERKVRSKLLHGGGVDSGRYSESCTHVIVDKIVYDDPMCVAARKDGKILVTGLWVEHSFDTGMVLDATAVMYRPLKDPNGIPGAKSMVVCLTGYQRQDRDDIMTMVGLMGAQFSKPLVANKVTHLVCYKFEGEKYELAKKFKTMKLVNHQWLQDCLRGWEIVPEANYAKSGYELEIMEAEAKDSEEEVEELGMQQQPRRSVKGSPYNLQPEQSIVHELPLPSARTEPAGASSTEAYKVKDIPLGTGKDSTSDCTFGLNSVNRKQIGLLDNLDMVTHNAGTGKQSDSSDRTPVSNRAGNTLPSTSGSAKGYLQSGSEKYNALSYSRKPRNITSRSLEARLVEQSVKKELENCSNSTRSCSKSRELSPEEGLGGTIPQKRKTDTSSLSAKSPKTCHDSTPSSIEIPSASERPGGFDIAALVNGPRETKNPLSFEHNEDPPDTSTDSLHNPVAINSISKSTASDKDTSACYSAKSSTISSNAPWAKAPQMESGRLKSPTSVSTPAKERKWRSPQNLQQDVEGSSPNMKRDVDRLSPNRKRDADGSSPNMITVEVEKPLGDTSLVIQEGKNSNSCGKQYKRNMGVKNGLGSKLRLSKTDADNRKGSIFLNKTSSQHDVATLESGREETGEHVKSDAGNNHSSVRNVAEPLLEVETTTELDAKTESLDDETEAPEADDEVEEAAHGKSAAAHSDVKVKEILEGTLPACNEGTHDAFCNNDAAGSSGAGRNKTEPGKALSTKQGKTSGSVLESVALKGRETIGKKRTLGQAKREASTVTSLAANVRLGGGGGQDENAKTEVEGTKKSGSADQSENGDFGDNNKDNFLEASHNTLANNDETGVSKMRKISAEREKTVAVIKDVSAKAYIPQGKKTTTAKKRPLRQAKKKTSAMVVIDSNICLDEEGAGKTEMEVTKVSLPGGHSKHDSVSLDKMNNFAGVEKENEPVLKGGQTSSQDKQHIPKAVKRGTKTAKTNQKEGKSTHSAQVASSSRMMIEPVWFILSGHRLQRKEFQQVIRRLKGKVCRDSHHWSYQATHFIAPDPLRRTEKLFAALASGRWVLNTDYLAASSQAGRFLSEEPYEWHKNGLSEDGAINLEAPRRWRLLKEKTGHGALYGMRIIIYGECIAPSLDTMKRVVKAGDGAILATSPPYTKFLKSGVDFAIVSPSMPRVDLWIQEFLRHEIPCVLADYLVEYVCKPGFPLERHVLYNTQAWAEKAFNNLLQRSEETVEDVTTPENHATTDLTCKVCGSDDRGEEMLICGDENGSVGCGIGTHIDCCDPPLEAVPKDDWFCPECSSESRRNRSRGR